MNENFCIIGNSHTSQFDNAEMNVLYGYGASICGLYNEKSVLQMKTKILQYQAQSPEKTLVFFLGQTDIEFIYYYRAILSKTKIPIDDFINVIVKQYVDFVKKYIKKPIILGINPTVTKHSTHIFNVNFRDNPSNTNPSGGYYSDIIYDDVKDYYDDFETRFNNNLKFNCQLKHECEQNNIIYVDINDEVLNEKGSVKEIYKPVLQDDHHLVKNIRLYNALINKIKYLI